MVLMIARALQLYGFPVQKKSFGSIEGDSANPETSLIPIDNAALGLNFRHKLVQVSLFQRPKQGPFDVDLLLEGLHLPIVN